MGQKDPYSTALPSSNIKMVGNWKKMTEKLGRGRWAAPVQSHTEQNILIHGGGTVKKGVL